ncbi:CIS tube protein [Nitrospina sp. 32_T5]|uniref:CIS tube protein n=1 Tax=unclassified Nitrospina TaxID=2638683 RepID=UPI003F9E6AE2
MYNVTRGILVEYALSVPPLTLVFDFNPESLSRTRAVTLKEQTAPGTAGGYDFATPTETPRVSQGVEVKAEEFSIDILLDATDRMNDDEPIAKAFGIGPELDTLRTMVEPKAQGPGGLQVLASLGHGGGRAFQRNSSASVLLFIWGTHVLPVFLTSVKVDEKAHLPNLVPYRAQATLSFQVIEGNNPFYEAEKVRQVIGAGLNTARTVSSAIGGLF